MGQQNRKHRPLVPLLRTLGIIQILACSCAQNTDNLEYISSLGAESPSPHTLQVYDAQHSCVSNATA